VAAPGVDILSLRAAGTDMYGDGKHIVADRYYYASGTSMACPHVAGVAGLILAAHPFLSNTDVRRMLRGTAFGANSGEERYIGTGILNAWQALEMNPQVDFEAEITDPPEEVFLNPGVIEIGGTAYGYGDWILEYRLGSQFYGGTGWQRIANGSSNVVDGVLARWEASNVPDGRYVLRLSVPYDGYGYYSARAYRSFTVDRDIKGGWGRQPFAGGDLCTTPLVADFDGDGLEEIFVADYLGKACLYDPDGVPMAGWPVEIGQEMMIGAPAAADLDGDGDLEVVWPTKFTLEAYHHTGRPVKGWPRVSPGTDQTYPASLLALADLAGDGDIQIIAGWWRRVDDETYASLLAVYESDGTFAPGWPVQFAGYMNGGFAIGDVDGDGRAEIACSIWGQGHYILRSDGTFYPGWPVPWHDQSSGTYMTPAFGDFDGDGETEVFFGENTEIHVFELDGTRLPGWPYDLGVSTFGPVAWGDLDGDGDLELVVGPGIGESEVLALHHDATPVRGWPVDIEVGGFTLGGSDPAPAISDIDHDGLSEVVIVSPGNRHQLVYALEADGSMIPNWPKRLNDAYFATKTGPTISDLDHDGTTEVIVASRAGDLLVWEVPSSGGASGTSWWVTECQNAQRTNTIRNENEGFRVSPASLSIHANVGDGRLEPETLTLGGNNRFWSAEEQVPWLDLSKTTGRTPDTVQVTIDVTHRRLQAQSFKAIGPRITAASIPLMKVGAPSEPIRVSIRRSLSSSAIASGQIDPAQVTSIDENNPGWVTVAFPSPAQVNEGSGYYLVLEVLRPDGANYYRVGYDKNNPYPYGMWYLDGTVRKDLDMACKITFGQ
jgi:hypothetical protein